MKVNKDAKRILIYGDSITYGRVPGSLERFDSEKRFTGVVQKNLGEDYEVIEEGLRGRMAFGENPGIKDRNGFIQFRPIILSHLPLDLIIIFLGTNDAKVSSPTEIVDGLEKYIGKIKLCCDEFSMKIPKICFVSPPKILERGLRSGSSFIGSNAKASELPEIIKEMAEKNGCSFFNGNKFSADEADGIHLNEEENKKLGEELAEFVKEIV